MKTCDYCGRDNSDDAAHCRECGTRFGPEDEPELFKRPERLAVVKKILFGTIFCLVGFLVTLLTWFYLQPGLSGTVGLVIACGAILFGAFLLFRGYADREKQRGVEEIGSDALSHAKKLEAEGRPQEALVVYQLIARQYPNSNPGRDAEKNIKNLCGTLTKPNSPEKTGTV